MACVETLPPRRHPRHAATGNREEVTPPAPSMKALRSDQRVAGTSAEETAALARRPP